MLHVEVVGHGHVERGDALDRCVELVVELLLELRGELSADAGGLVALLDDCDLVRLAGGGEERVGIERSERARVDDLNVDAVKRELLGCLIMFAAIILVQLPATKKKTVE